jgi:hypothetical protein
MTTTNRSDANQVEESYRILSRSREYLLQTLDPLSKNYIAEDWNARLEASDLLRNIMEDLLRNIMEGS